MGVRGGCGLNLLLASLFEPYQKKLSLGYTYDNEGSKQPAYSYRQPCFFQHSRPASVAQLDVRSTGDQEVAGSTPAEVSNILLWRLIMKYFL